MANDNCPSSEVEKKKFSDAHSILYYVKKDDPRGDVPENPDDDPQFKNWEKAVEKWLEDEKGYSSNSTPTKECKADDFKKFGPSINLSSSNGNSSPLIIKINADAPFGVKKIILSINGDDVTSSSDSSFEYNYSVPDSKKNSDISIKASIEDKKGNIDSTSISVQTNIL